MQFKRVQYSILTHAHTKFAIGLRLDGMSLTVPK